jgi:phosphatidylserine/phosphatidylglycerophosphate/cardiolipin synthase-like enzyme
MIDQGKKVNTMLKRLILICTLSSFVLIQGCAGSSHTNLVSLPAKSITCPVIHACFTPGQDCTHQITDEIGKAEHSILVQAYGFSSKDIADELIAAKNRGVKVKVILDKSQRKQKYSLLHYIVESGIPVWIDTKPAIAHNKVMIIDGKEVVTGSFNFTDAAQKRNAENVVFISDSKLAKEYIHNWENREKQSIHYCPQ